MAVVFVSFLWMFAALAAVVTLYFLVQVFTIAVATLWLFCFGDWRDDAEDG